jgi:hypothetical protein
LRWEAEHALAFAPVPRRTLRLFVDGPVVELFLHEDAVAVSAAIAPAVRPMEVRLEAAGDAVPFGWFLPPA